MRELFVYYRVRPDSLAAARALVDAIHAQLRIRHPGLTTRLLTREAEAADQAPTWMEVYVMADASAAGVTPAIEADVQAGAAPLLNLLEGPRRVEAFVKR